MAKAMQVSSSNPQAQRRAISGKQPGKNRGNDRDKDRGRAPGDGTRELLQWGGSIVGAGVLAGILLVTVLGGYTRLGATTNAGWLALIVALMCIPFGSLLLTLGVAKWLRNRRLARER